MPLHKGIGSALFPNIGIPAVGADEFAQQSRGVQNSLLAALLPGSGVPALTAARQPGAEQAGRLSLPFVGPTALQQGVQNRGPKAAEQAAIQQEAEASLQQAIAGFGAPEAQQDVSPLQQLLAQITQRQRNV